MAAQVLLALGATRPQARRGPPGLMGERVGVIKTLALVVLVEEPLPQVAVLLRVAA